MRQRGPEALRPSASACESSWRSRQRPLIPPLCRWVEGVHWPAGLEGNWWCCIRLPAAVGGSQRVKAAEYRHWRGVGPLRHSFYRSTALPRLLHINGSASAAAHARRAAGGGPGRAHQRLLGCGCRLCAHTLTPVACKLPATGAGCAHAAWVHCCPSVPLCTAVVHLATHLQCLLPCSQDFRGGLCSGRQAL